MTPELFGVHPVVGARRVDCCRALMVSSGNPIAEIAPDLIRYANGLAYRRTPPGGPTVPVWQFGAEQQGYSGQVVTGHIWRSAALDSAPGWGDAVVSLKPRIIRCVFIGSHWKVRRCAQQFFGHVGPVALQIRVVVEFV